MAGFFREVAITWKGEEYLITPTMQILRRIESGGISLPLMITNIVRGEAQTSHMALALCILLRSAGAEVKDDEIYGVLMTGHESEVGDLRDALILALSPAEVDEKKTAASG